MREVFRSLPGEELSGSGKVGALSLAIIRRETGSWLGTCANVAIQGLFHPGHKDLSLVSQLNSARDRALPRYQRQVELPP